MAKPHPQVWYLEEWFETQKMKQHDLVKGLGWLPAKANKIWHGVQPPKLHEAAEIAEMLNIRTHELLMPPEEAFRIRRLEAVIAEVPKGEPPEGGPTPAAPVAAEGPTERAVRRAR